jgi:hypothetical protein
VLVLQRQHVLLLEQAAVELQQLAHEAELRALVHGAPQLPQPAGKGGGVRQPMLLQRPLEELVGQQSHVLGEHGEEAAHQERGDALADEAVLLQRFRQPGQVRGDLAGDLGCVQGRIE